MNLDTTYMGLKLKSPIVVSACTLTEEVDNIVRMEDAGAGAVVLFSLFEEQIKQESSGFDNVFNSTTNAFAEAKDFFPNLNELHVGSEGYLDLIRKAKERVDIPIIGSLNGITTEGWIDYSRQMEKAGADGIEINVFFIPADINLSGAAVEHRYLNIITEIKNNVKIPIAVKLNPYFSSLGFMAQRMEQAGANGLVLFNRFYQPDFDINELKILSNLEYSEANEIRLPLLWIALLYGKIKSSIAATTGVQSAVEVVKYILAGADVVMTASSLFKNGIIYIERLNKDLEEWMQMMQFDSLDAFRGSMSQLHVSDPTAYERANYIKILKNI